MTSTSPLKTVILTSDQDSTGRDLGAEELELLEKVIHSGTLTSTKGFFTRSLEERFAAMLGVRKAHACASGTAAIHVAVAALDPNPGDEIVTTSITDMGALTPLLYQGAIPVFAEVYRQTMNVTAPSVAAWLSERTKRLLGAPLIGCACE